MRVRLRFVCSTLATEEFKRKMVSGHVIHLAARLCLLGFPSVVHYVYILTPVLRSMLKDHMESLIQLSRFRTRATGSPAFTTSFGLTNSFSTLDPASSSSARTAISNFIASKIVTTSFALSSSPSLATTFQTLAFSGLVILDIAGSKKRG